MDLASVIERVLRASKGPMGIPAIVAAVRKAGYASSSPSFARIVGMRLGDRKKFRRVGRGMYAAAGGGGAKAGAAKIAKAMRSKGRKAWTARKARASKPAPPKPPEPNSE